MQISRHWRLNAQRYRLEGTRTVNGEVRFQPRMQLRDAETNTKEVTTLPPRERVSVAAR